MKENLILSGEAADVLGVSTRMLAFLEEKGLLQPVMRLPWGGRFGLRLYRKEDVQRLAREREANRAAGNGRGAKAPVGAVAK